MRRILCLWFPNWTIQRWRRAEPATRSAALVVSAEIAGRGLRVTACCPNASRLGVHEGMPLAEARALLQSARSPLRTDWKSADPAADRDALRQIALDCQRYTPLTGLDDDGESVLLDITGCAHLFGDEVGLLGTVTRDLTERGFQYRTAIAGTLGAAWAIAHAGPTNTIIPAGNEQSALEALPVAALRLPLAIVATLDRLAVQTVSDLLRLPRSSLSSRFGPELLQRLNQALGLTWESFTPERLATALFAQWSADDPLTDQRQLSFVFRQLLADVLTQLSPRRAGLLELVCKFRGESETVKLPLHLAQPAIELRHIAQLFDLACERQTLPGEVFRFRLEAPRIGCLDERQFTLFDAEDSHERDLTRLIERLSSRLGAQAVLRPVAAADPLPEQMLNFFPWLDSTNQPAAYVPPQECRTMRPWHLLPTPERIQVVAPFPNGPPRRLTWQGRDWNIRQCWGPERIECGWWRTWDVQRDYYRVETEEGFEFWVFRDRRAEAWFFHGSFD